MSRSHHVAGQRLTLRSRVLLENIIVAQLVEEVPRLLWDKNFHYHVLKSPPFDSILSYLSLVHSLSPYFCKIFLKLSYHLRVGLPCFLFHSDFATKNVYVILIVPTYATLPIQLIIIHLITLKI